MAPDPNDLELLRKMYPELSDAELVQADENLTRYVSVVLRIFERLHPDLVDEV